jgi:hypothetical protein
MNNWGWATFWAMFLQANLVTLFFLHIENRAHKRFLGSVDRVLGINSLCKYPFVFMGENKETKLSLM